MSTHNICFYGEIRKVSYFYHQCAIAHSDQNVYWAHFGQPGKQRFFMRLANTQKCMRPPFRKLSPVFTFYVTLDSQSNDALPNRVCSSPVAFLIKHFLYLI